MIVFLLMLCLLRISIANGYSGAKLTKSSLVFVIDDTGSMSNDIAQVKQGADAIFDTIMNSNASQIEDIILVTFNDPTTRLRIITKDRYAFKAQLSSIVVNGGGSCPEYAMSGIKLALEQSLPGSNIFVFTDASAEDYAIYPEVKSLAIKKQSRVIFVLTGTCPNNDGTDDVHSRKYRVYHDLAKVTYGQVFHMATQEIGQILEYVRYIIGERKNIIRRSTFPPGYDNELKFNVDGKLKNVVISTSGVDPKISVTGPNGSIPKTKDLMKTAKVAITQIVETKPGPHVAKVGSKSETDAVITGASSFNFIHGFSILKPSSLNDTTTRPVPDTKSYLSIKHEEHDGIKLQTVKIIDIDDKVINEFTLTIVNDEEQLYLTELFQPPKTIFRISVTGYDPATDETITRIGQPVEQQDIVPREPKAPTATIEEGPKIHTDYDKPLHLKCKVNAFPEPEITWTDKDTGDVLPSTVSVLEIGSEYISILNIEKVVKNQTYQCIAKNTINVNIDTIEVETNVPIHFNILEAPIDTTIVYMEEGKLICKVDAFPPPTINWLFYDEPIIKNDFVDISDGGSVLTIKKMLTTLGGTFTCEASNGIETKKMKARLSIGGVEMPVIDKTIKTMHVLKGTNQKVECKIIEGKPMPNIRWFFKSKLDKSYHKLESTEESLQLNNVSPNQTGSYQCKVKNVMGKSSHRVKVYVEYAPTIEERERKIVAKVEEELTLKCNVDGVPIPKVTWYKDAVQIYESTKYNISKDHSLLFKVTAKDSGKYGCKAENDIGFKTETTEIDVHVKPKIDKSVSTIQVRKGSDTSINCNLIEGHPKVTIAWYFKAQRRHRFVLLGDITDNSINMRNVDTSMSGTYKCTATNIVGSDTHKIVLDVVYPAVIKKDIDRLNVKEGEYSLLNCRVDGIPIPTVKWLKDGALIDSKDYEIYKDHSLRHNFTLKDSGNYTCLADNTVGTANKSIIVDVFVPVTIRLPHETTIQTKEGEEYVQLECDADGYPKPDITWTFYGVDSPPRNITTEASSSDLILYDIKREQHGYYVCSASNYASSTNITYQLLVNAPPIITNTYLENNFDIVEGDRVLIIWCNATGYPKPTITWEKDQLLIATGSKWYDMGENGALIIKNIDLISEGTYSCIAKNSGGSVEEFFQVTVNDYPEISTPYAQIMIEKGTNASIKCDVPHDIVDLLRWFKDETLVETGELNINNVTAADAGMYTCRVSNFSSSSSSSVQVDVGFKPEFMEEETSEETNINLVEGAIALLNCKADGIPFPKVSWWHDDKEIIASDFMTHTFYMQLSDRGKYECRISNIYGNISRTFVINSKDCFLNIEKDFSVNQPLIQPSPNFLNYNTVDGYLRIPKGDYVSLSCPNKFTKFTKPFIIAFCDEELNFKVSGKVYKYSDFECTEEIKPVVKQTGMKCLPSYSDTENIKVAYEISGVTVDIYEICLDKDRNIPVYTKHNIHRATADLTLNTTEWSNSDLVPLDFGTLYDCEQQMNTMSSVLGRWFHRYDNCCFAKRQLVSPRDMTPGLAQKATFNNLNVVPQWSTCNSKNWDDMENKVRGLAKSTDHSLLVWTGTSHNLTMLSILNTTEQININDRNGNQQAVPQFIWKVVQDPRSKSSLAIVQINVPDLIESKANEYVWCRDICRHISWMKIGMWHDVTRGYIYCCTLQEFERAFGYNGIFETDYGNILYNVAYVSNHTLT